MLLERERPLRAVGDRLRSTGVGEGALILVGGEAGVGKSALVTAAARQARDAGFDVLMGACDGLVTPRALGPFRDIASDVGDQHLLAVIDGEALRHEVFSACLELFRSGGPRLVVIEDLHWADEATLDLLRFLGRRIASTGTVLLCTYRDDELDMHMPLRILLGELWSSEQLLRIALPPLSPDAVAVLAAGHDVDAADLHRRTGGNPFFVTEILEAAGDELPVAVRDAVLSRAARLSPGARAVLEAAAVVPPRIEIDLLFTMCPGASREIDECQRRGMLVTDGSGLRFRHELARTAIDSDVPVARRVELHRQVLRWLRGGGGEQELARIVHHAVAGADVEAILEFAPLAAARAAHLGAHREASAHYGAAVVAGAGRLSDGALAELLSRQAYESYLSEQHIEALALHSQALAFWRKLGDSDRAGQSLHHTARLLWTIGRRAEAAAAANEAIALLEALEPGAELAMALSTRSQLAMRGHETAAAIAYGERALRLAESLGEEATAVHALTNIGAAEFLATADFERSASESGAARLEEAVRRARASAHEEYLARALLNLGAVYLFRREYGRARRAMDEGVAHCDERGLDGFGMVIRADRARLLLELGDLEGAATNATEILRRSASQDARVVALTVLGRVRALRGDPGVWEVLDEAWAIAEGQGEVQFLGAAAVARIEAAVLLGSHREEAVTDALRTLRLTGERSEPWVAGALSVWLKRADAPHRVSTRIAEPWSLELSGEARRAAETWQALGCPYEAAMATAWAATDDELERRQAVEQLFEMGARQAAAVAARRLREEGIRGVPRGAHRATLANPAQLTPRELETLALLSEGLTNAEMAARMFVATKTMEHHVSAVLGKLGAHSRTAALREAGRRGILISGSQDGDAVANK
jgi:DNA-binding CsgD family transcriptional regulator/tetratricopeptide (TPR) repeat protein